MGFTPIVLPAVYLTSDKKENKMKINSYIVES
jgi:hypothetical protein